MQGDQRKDQLVHSSQVLIAGKKGCILLLRLAPGLLHGLVRRPRLGPLLLRDGAALLAETQDLRPRPLRLDSLGAAADGRGSGLLVDALAEAVLVGLGGLLAVCGEDRVSETNAARDNCTAGAQYPSAEDGLIEGESTNTEEGKKQNLEDSVHIWKQTIRE